jgi:hypothetical protein
MLSSAFMAIGIIVEAIELLRLDIAEADCDNICVNDSLLASGGSAAVSCGSGGGAIAIVELLLDTSVPLTAGVALVRRDKGVANGIALLDAACGGAARGDKSNRAALRTGTADSKDDEP